MSNYNKNQEIRKALAVLATAHAHAVAEIERAIEELSFALDVQEPVEALLNLNKQQAKQWPRADRETLSVTWKSHTCFLGNTLPFLFFERLVRTPNRYVNYEQFREEVWGGEDPKDSTIRGIAKRLRDKLRESGMKPLAEAIDGSVNGHYGLKLV